MSEKESKESQYSLAPSSSAYARVRGVTAMETQMMMSTTFYPKTDGQSERTI